MEYKKGRRVQIWCYDKLYCAVCSSIHAEPCALSWQNWIHWAPNEANYTGFCSSILVPSYSAAQWRADEVGDSSMSGTRPSSLVYSKGSVAHLLLSSLWLLQEFDLVVSNWVRLHLIRRKKMTFVGYENWNEWRWHTSTNWSVKVRYNHQPPLQNCCDEKENRTHAKHDSDWEGIHLQSNIHRKSIIGMSNNSLACSTAIFLSSCTGLKWSAHGLFCYCKRLTKMNTELETKKDLLLTL
jgi:hypothetical protein